MPHPFEHRVSCIGESSKALQLQPLHDPKAPRFWVPKSVIDDDSEVFALGHAGTLVVADWFAEKEGWE